MAVKTDKGPQAVGPDPHLVRRRDEADGHRRHPARSFIGTAEMPR